MNDNDDNLKLASVDYVDSKCSGGELKAKTWVCVITADGGGGVECSFTELKKRFNEGLQPDIESMRDYTWTKGIIKFTEEKSLIEVNKWLMFEAKIIIYGDYILVNDPEMFAGYTPFAVCPWPEDKPWPDAN